MANPTKGSKMLPHCNCWARRLGSFKSNPININAPLCNKSEENLQVREEARNNHLLPEWKGPPSRLVKILDQTPTDFKNILNLNLILRMDLGYLWIHGGSLCIWDPLEDLTYGTCSPNLISIPFLNEFRMVSFFKFFFPPYPPLLR